MISQGGPPDDGEDGGSKYTPPGSTRFGKGQSGNSAGRPRGRHREAPYEAVLGQVVTIRENGIERQVKADAAFLLNLSKRALEGDKRAAREILTVIDQFKKIVGTTHEYIRYFTHSIVDPESVTYALIPLRMGRKLDPYRETARMVLEPWLVEAALARLGPDLSPVQQRIIVKATRTPHKVKWPQWWSEYP